MRGPILLVVALSYGMTFDQGRLVDRQDLTVPTEQLPFSTKPRRDAHPLRLTFDRIVDVVEGSRTSCLDAVEKHLRSLGS
jgi:hypothetical protein